MNYIGLRNSLHWPIYSTMVFTMATAVILLSMGSACNRLSKNIQEESKEIDSQLLQEVPYLAFDDFRSAQQLDWISQFDNFTSLPDLVRCAVLSELWFQQYGDSSKANTNWYTSILGNSAHVGDIIILVGVDNKLRSDDSKISHWPLLLYVDQTIVDQLFEAMSHTKLRFLNWEENKEDKELILEWERSGEPFKSTSDLNSFVSTNRPKAEMLTLLGSGSVGNELLYNRAFHFYKLPQHTIGDGYIFQVFYADKEEAQVPYLTVNMLSFKISIRE